MGYKRDDLLALLETTNLNPSLNYWCSLLNFAEDNKHSLTISDLEIICAESERCREFYNGDRRYTTTIFRNGKEVEIELTKQPLNIDKEEVAPNVYRILEEKIEEQRLLEEERETETKTYTRERESMEVPIPLAAFPA